MKAKSLKKYYIIITAKNKKDYIIYWEVYG